MAAIALQGVRGGVGATSLTAALGWALSALGERVLLIEAAPGQLGAHFNVPLESSNGWMQALCAGEAWQDSALRYPQGPDLLLHGVPAQPERFQQDAAIAQPLFDALPELKKRYQWIIFDLPHYALPWHQRLQPQLNSVLRVIVPDASCHLYLSQQHYSAHSHFLINQFHANSRLQQDLHQFWIASLNNMIPLLVHRDEALAEALMMKQPVGEYKPHALVSEEIITLANWLLLHLPGAAQ